MNEARPEEGLERRPLVTEAGQLWRDPAYRAIWHSLLLGSLAGQVGNVALGLTAALTLHASPAEIGLLAALGNLPYALFLLPAGVWLDRVRKLPVYRLGELCMALALLAVPLAWMTGRLNMPVLYAVAFIGGCVSVATGTAGQILISRVVRREQLIEAHSRSRVAIALAEITGPGLGGLLVRLFGGPLAVLGNIAGLLASVAVLGRLKIDESPAPPGASFRIQLIEGLRFVFGHRLLLSMALGVGGWQVFQTAAMVTQVLFATRELGLDAFGYGLCLALAGSGSIAAGHFGHRLAQHLGPGNTMLCGMAISGAGWLQLALMPPGPAGVSSLLLMLICFGVSVVLIFSNLLALRQAHTPPEMLGRMTSTMRWLTLFPAAPGLLLGGQLAEHFGLRLPLAFGGIGALLLALGLWRLSHIGAARTPAVPTIVQPADADGA